LILRSADDIDLTDLLVTAAESWKILLIGPVLVALIAFGVLQLLPKQYESVATVVLSEKISRFLVAPGGIDAVMLSSGSDQEDAGARASRRVELVQFKVSARNPVTGIVEIDVFSSDLQRLRALVPELVNRLAALAAADRGAAAKQVQSKIDAYVRQNELLGKIVGSLTSNAPVITSSNLAQNDSADFAVAALRLTNEIRDNQIAIAGFDEDLAETRKLPSPVAITPAQPVSRNSIAISILSLTLSLAALIAFVFGREAFRKASADAKVSAKFARIRQAFWKPRS
jgi:hypothetical protein